MVGTLVAGCTLGDDDSSDHGTESAYPGPHLRDLGPTWNQIKPGGDTRCARGGEFSFFFRKGTRDAVALVFAGGGACWDAATCSTAGQLFEDEVDLASFPFVSDEERGQGIFDVNAPNNPIRDWHWLFVPYCTGDIHWGDAQQTYGATTIEHRGAVNVRSVLEFLYGNFARPERVFVAGLSAGAYGSIVWLPHIRKHYDDAGVSAGYSQLGDSGAGVITADFFQTSVAGWNPSAAYPVWIPGGDPGTDGRLSQLYSAIGAYHPDTTLAQFNTAYDETQVLYYAFLEGAGPAEWSMRMRESISQIDASTPNFRSYIAPGTGHTILLDDALYTLEEQSVKLDGWVTGIVNGTPLGDVSCSDCGEPSE